MLKNYRHKKDDNDKTFAFLKPSKLTELIKIDRKVKNYVIFKNRRN